MDYPYRTFSSDDLARIGRIEAVVLDMDGLLLDTERISMRAWQEGCREYGLNLPDALFLTMIGRREADCMGVLVSTFGSAIPSQAIANRCNAIYREKIEARAPDVMPGVHTLLDWLDERQLPRLVATSTAGEKARFKLEATDLWPRLDGLVSGQDVAHGKPAPDVFLHAADTLGVKPESCLVLEDSGPGITGANRAGMLAVLIPDLRIPDPPELSLAHAVFPGLGAFVMAMTKIQTAFVAN